MQSRASWLLVPASLTALLAVLALAAAVPPAGPGVDAGDAAVAAAAAVGRGERLAAAGVGEGADDLVVLRDATGRRSAPLPFRMLTSNAVVLDCGASLAGQRLSLRVFRRLAAGREAEPWLSAMPRVRGDGLLPVGGLPAGCCDFEVVVPGALEQTLGAEAVTVPGDGVRPVLLQPRGLAAPR